MFEPDIIVTERGDYAERFIVVEVKSTPSALLSIEEQLRTYMVRNNFSLGMLVAPGEVRLYKNKYTSYQADSIALLGAFPLSTFDDFATIRSNDRIAMARFEDAVQAWIERLPSEATLASLDAPLREAVEDNFAPYIRIGEVRAAGHRHWPMAAAESRRP